KCFARPLVLPIGRASSSWLAIPSQQIECCADWAEGLAGGVAAQRLADCIDVGAILERKRQNDRAVSGVGIRLISCLVIVQKQFRDVAIRETTHGGGEAQPADLERERLVCPSIGESAALAHCVASTPLGHGSFFSGHRTSGAAPPSRAGLNPNPWPPISRRLPSPMVRTYRQIVSRRNACSGRAGSCQAATRSAHNFRTGDGARAVIPRDLQ